MAERRIERRRRDEAPRVEARSSPANVLILSVIGVLGLLAVTTAMVGTGFDDKTPHGKILGDLQRVAHAQELHHQRHGTFAELPAALDLEASSGVRLTITRGNGSSWEAVASHDVGLTCVQTGQLDTRGRPIRVRPVCYMDGGR